MWQKRPVYMAKKTCLDGKRDLFMWQKRPVYVAKETCLFDYDIGLGAEDVLVHAGRNIYLYI